MKRRMVLIGGAMTLAATAGCLDSIEEGTIDSSPDENDNGDDNSDSGENNESSGDESDDSQINTDEEGRSESNTSDDSDDGDDRDEEAEDDVESEDDEDGDSVPTSDDIGTDIEVVGRKESDLDVDHAITVSSDGAGCTLDIDVQNTVDDYDLTVRVNASTRNDDRRTIDAWTSERMILEPDDSEAWDVPLACEEIDHYRIVAEIITWEELGDGE